MDADKTKQRRAALGARRAMTTAARASASAKICFRLLALPQLHAAKTILSYRALDDEVDLGAVEGKLTARIAYPLCLGQGAMEARIPSRIRRPRSCSRRRRSTWCCCPVWPLTAAAIVWAAARVTMTAICPVAKRQKPSLWPSRPRSWRMLPRRSTTETRISL